MYGEADDIAVIEKVLRGDKSAYGAIVERYQQYVFTLTLRYVNNREVAEELAQDVFVKAYKCLADFRGNSKFSTWLYTIVNTTCLTHLRKKKQDTVSMDDRIIDISDSSFSEPPSARHEQRTQKILIENALKHISANDAQILTLFYLAEQSVDEIGVIKGITTTNVKVQLFRARQKLKEVLERKFRGELI